MPKQQRGIKVICEEGEKSFSSNLWLDTLPLSSTELARGNGALIYMQTQYMKKLIKVLGQS